MSLASDSLIERIRLKKHLTRWRAIAIALLVFIGYILMDAFVSKQGFSGDYIARVEISDLILEDYERTRILNDLSEDDDVRGIILYINSPGGTMVGGETLHQSILRLSKKKPLVAVMGSMATSGAYMTAIAAPKIYAQAGTITGSIGVIFQMAEITELSEKIGVNFMTFKSSPLKASPSPFEKLTPAATAAINNVIAESYRIFLSMVEERRKLPHDVALKLADGRIYTGTQAKQNKLIDEIGDEIDAKAWLVKQYRISPQLRVKEVSTQKKSNEFASLFSSTFPFLKPFLHDRQPTQGVLALWKPGSSLTF